MDPPFPEQIRGTHEPISPALHKLDLDAFIQPPEPRTLFSRSRIDFRFVPDKDGHPFVHESNGLLRGRNQDRTLRDSRQDADSRTQHAARHERSPKNEAEGHGHE